MPSPLSFSPPTACYSTRSTHVVSWTTSLPFPHSSHSPTSARYPFSFLPSPRLSRLPNPTHGLDILPTHGADVHLPRALLARHHMPAVVEQSIHLALIANLTHGQLFIRDFVIHHPLAVSSALFPPADVHVLRFAVNHLAFAVGLVVFPIANVGISG